MVGPVLYLEMLLGSRRGKQYIFRWLYAGWLILQFSFLYLIYRAQASWGSSRNVTADFAGHYVQLFIVQQFILFALAIPTMVAGAVTDEKTSGTLTYLFSADLTAGEIILGKLLGRLAQVMLLALTGLPILCLVGVFGGLNPLMLIMVMLVSLPPLFTLSAASLLASVWSRQTRDAVLGLYAALAGGLIVVGLFLLLVEFMFGPVLPGWLSGVNSLLAHGNPLYVLEPGWGNADLRELLRRLLLSVALWGGGGLLCLGLAVWQLKPAYIRQLEGAGKPKKRHWWRAQRNAVGDAPILWKERQVEGIAPLTAIRHIPRWLGVSLIGVTTVAVIVAILLAHLPDTSGRQLLALIGTGDVSSLLQKLANAESSANAFLMLNWGVVLVASLVVGIRCSGAVSGEREKQTWEALLMTPLETRRLIRDKVWGIIGASVPYLLAYAIPATALAGLGGIVPLFWTLLGLAIMVLAMFFVGSTGIWCSVRAKSSWRALLGTLGISYVGGFLLYLMFSPLILIVAILIYLFLLIIDASYGTTTTRAVGFADFYVAFVIASGVGLALIFLLVSWYFLRNAEKWVADRERIRFWKTEPLLAIPAPPPSVRPRYYR